MATSSMPRSFKTWETIINNKLKNMVKQKKEDPLPLTNIGKTAEMLRQINEGRKKSVKKMKTAF